MTLWNSDMPALRRQHLLVEFSGLKTACPHGVFMSLTPNDPTVWPGAMFIRNGPYASSILQFEISFPASYPRLPPQVKFLTDMFHPLITPLTTYMYTTDIQMSGTSSVADYEQLSPGGFSLRHGFPEWFGREKTEPKGGYKKTQSNNKENDSISAPSTMTSSKNSGTDVGSRITPKNWKQEIGIYEVLRYIRSTFDNEDVLDQIPLNVAGNPGAWHAWQTHRLRNGSNKQVVHDLHNFNTSPRHNDMVAKPEKNSPVSKMQEDINEFDGAGLPPLKSKNPGEWNWDGVWEFRVNKCVKTSLSESVLFGKDTSDNLIRFLNLNMSEIETIKENIKRSLEETEPYRRRLYDIPAIS